MISPFLNINGGLVRNNGVKTLQDLIVSRGGLVVSTDTLRPDHLVNAFGHNLVIHYQLPFPNYRDLSLMLDEYSKQLDNLPDQDQAFQDQVGELLDELYIYFDSIAPDGYYFGSQEGDGACFGFWQYSETDCF